MFRKFSSTLIGLLAMIALIGCGAGSIISRSSINSLFVDQYGTCTDMVPGSTCSNINVAYYSNTGAQLSFTGLTSPFHLTTSPSPCATPTATPQTCELTIKYNNNESGSKTQTLTISLTGTTLSPSRLQVSGQ